MSLVTLVVKPPSKRVVKPFIDSNIGLYLLSNDSVKASAAERLIAAGAIISVQVLNEMTNVMRRKLKLPWPATIEILEMMRADCELVPLTIESHQRGVKMARRYNFAIYDAMIVGSALEAGCTRLYSEDMQHGLLVDGQLLIQNPFSQNPFA